MRLSRPDPIQKTGLGFAAGMLAAQRLFSICSSLIIRIVPHNYVASARSSPPRFNTSILMICASRNTSPFLQGKKSYDEKYQPSA
jgi:hypothetical protein